MPVSKIEKFEVHISDEDVEDLNSRLRHTRWPEETPTGEPFPGIEVATLRDLVTRLLEGFDWRTQEKHLNRLSHFRTEIDEQPIHFVHVRSEHAAATPLLLCHGWPGSFIDFLRVVNPLVDPTAHGGKAEDAFHLVIPSLPGFGFSNPVTGRGWSLARMGGAFVQLMGALGYERYALQAGDMGAGVTASMAALASDNVIASHTNVDMLGAAGTAGEFSPIDFESMTEDEQKQLTELKARTHDWYGYLHLQSTRPEPISYALTDSPVGQLTWMAERFVDWTNPDVDGLGEAIDIDQFLTNFCLYWFTKSGASSARAMYEAMNARDWLGTSAITQGVSVFGGKSTVTRAIVDPDNSLAYWQEHEQGGHFPAMEAPDVFVSDVRSFFEGRR